MACVQRHLLKRDSGRESARSNTVPIVLAKCRPRQTGGIFVFMSEFDGFREQLSKAGVAPVVETMPADLLTPLAVYLKLSKGRIYSFLLESVSGGENLARYSFVGADPAMIVIGGDEEFRIIDASGERIVRGSALKFLRDHFERYPARDVDGLPTFIGGAIGYFGFGCSRWFEPSLKALNAATDDAAFMFYRSIVAFDHARQEIKLISLVFADEARSEDQHSALFEQAGARNTAIRRCLEDQAAVVPTTEASCDAAEVRSNFSQPDFENAVREIKELIAAGECYQVVLSQRFEKRTNANAVSIYRAVRSLNPSPYMFLLDLDGKAVVGASPEMLVRCRGRDLEYRPIAGTRPRGRTEREDSALAEEMRRDNKEVAEHVMLVDLGRNDVGRVCEYGSVAVRDLMSVEKYSHVQHLVSSITGTLRGGLDRFDALAACFPAGTVSGAPKLRAVDIIGRLEPTPRGIYAGAVGYFDYAGNMDTCITIRTLVLENGVATVQAGAGIVADSVPEMEFRETVNKARAMFKAIEIAEGGGR